MTLASRRAIVRPPGESYLRALTHQRPAPPVDLALARDQHAGYVAALRECGLEVTVLPADDAHPDSVFVQDRVLVADGRAIVCPSAVEARQGEEETLLAGLDPVLTVQRLAPPAFLDGGDILVTEESLFVGLSSRSNGAAVDQLGSLLAPGLRVEGVTLPRNLLHLLSGCSYLGGGLLLATESVRTLAFAERFRIVPVPQEEAPAANVLPLGRNVVVPAGYPETARRIAEHGFRIHAVAASEFEKRDGGVTCLSVLY